MSESSLVYVPYAELVEKATKCLLTAGMPANLSQLGAEAICTASLRGTDSHGIRLLPHYLASISAGRIDPKAKLEFKQTTVSTGILDAHHGLGHPAVAMAMDHAVALAKQVGVGFVTIKNSTHCGAMAYYGLRAAARDMIGLAFTNATAKVKVFNAQEPFFGINPVCFTAPMADEDPFCYDAAPTIMSNNKIKIIKEQGGTLPPDVAADASGEMTFDPTLAKMLLPLGGLVAGYKGYGMAMVVDILCSLLSEMPNGRQVSTMYPVDGGTLGQRRYLGQLVGAIRIDGFTDVEQFKQRLQKTAEQVRGLAQAGNEAVMIPGDPEKRMQKKRSLEGIPVEREVWLKYLENSG